MKHIVSLKEFRSHVAQFADRVEQGDSFVIFKRSKPLFRIAPVDEEGWETVIDFTKFRKNGIPAEELLKRLKAN